MGESGEVRLRRCDRGSLKGVFRVGGLRVFKVLGFLGFGISRAYRVQGF